MSTMLQRMKERVQARTPQFERDYSIHAFWNLKFGSSSTFRLLPFNDPFSQGFWTEKVMLPMQFTDPNDPTKIIKFLAPCREMYDRSNKCPVLVPVRELYAEAKELKNTGNTKEAKKLEGIAGFHWKKPTFYYQGFVIKSGMAEDETPENPIRVFPFNKQIHGKIYSSVFENEEDPYETLPCGEFTMDDVKALLGDDEVDMSIFDGYNFIVKKNQQGEYAEWVSGSQWTKSQTPLTDEQLAALAQYGLHDLTLRLPARPSDDQYEVLAEMMNISVQRQLTGAEGVWNPEWEELGFKPLRQRGDKGNAAPASTPARSEGSTTKIADEGEGTGDALSRLKAKRGKAAPAPEETVEETVDEAVTEVADEAESPAEVAAAAADETVPEKAGATGVSDLAAKIKSRVSKGKQTA